MEHKTEKIVKNTALYTGAVIGQKALSFLYFWFLSSRFGPDELGGYLGVLALVGLFGIGIDLGLTPILTREAAAHEDGSVRMLRTVLAMKIPLALISSVGLIGLVVFTRPSAIAYLPAAVMILLTDAFTTALFATLRARQALAYEATTLLIFQLLVFASGAALITFTGSLPLVMFALSLGSAFNLAFMARAARRVVGGTILPMWDRATARHLLALVPAFAGGMIFTKLYTVADTILLGYLADDREVGLYSVPAKVVTALQTLLPGAFAAVIYPSMANFATAAPDKLRTLLVKSSGYLLVLAIPIATGLILLARQVLETIWPEYTESAKAFVAVMAGLPFMFLSFPTGSLLNAAGLQRKNTTNRVIVTAVNIVLNVLLIPRSGALGAAVAFTSSNIVLLILDGIAVLRVVRINAGELLNVAAKSAAAAAVMGLLLVLLRDRISLPFAIIASGAVYAALAIAFGAISREDWRAARVMFARRGIAQDV